MLQKKQYLTNGQDMILALQCFMSELSAYSEVSPLTEALLQMVASACSKVVASTATYPHEVVRSHMHISGTASLSSVIDVCKDVRISSEFPSNPLLPLHCVSFYIYTPSSFATLSGPWASAKPRTSHQLHKTAVLANDCFARHPHESFSTPMMTIYRALIARPLLSCHSE